MTMVQAATLLDVLATLAIHYHVESGKAYLRGDIVGGEHLKREAIKIELRRENLRTVLMFAIHHSLR